MKKIEREYLETVGQNHRKKFAQFFTPDIIVDFMRNWIFSGGKDVHIFDPAFGLGAFYHNCSSNIHFSGMDIDHKILEFFVANFPAAEASLSHGNYLLKFGNKYPNIICNPPYLKFQHFSDKDLFLEKIKMHYGIKLSGYTNTASAFLVKSIFELTVGGRLAYIMPSEFLNAGYGIAVKKLLVQKKHLRAIIKIECETEVFSDATTTLCILLYDSKQLQEQLDFFRVDTIEQLPGILDEKPIHSILYSDLNPIEKWDVYFSSRVDKNICIKQNLVKLSSYGHFSRGIATGANKFFVLKKSVISSLRLEPQDYIPCITKSQQINGPIFTKQDFESLSNSDSSVFLLNLKQSISSAARAYIKYGEDHGFNQRFLTKNRSPWYKMEHRDYAPILLNVFSRGGYKVIRNYSDVVTLTSFHSFYPNIFGYKYTDALFLYFLSGIGHEILSSSMRKYGHKLEKFEPNDLNNAMVPSEYFFSTIPSSKIEELIKKLQDGINIHTELNQLFHKLVP
ncbi:MAG: N-6 DNA methylase [Lentisphaeria bacterium]|nr:N-6 DNA methylase [Lentisphaeria bacterium]